MIKTIHESISRGILVVLFALTAGVACVLMGASSAYAAEADASTDNLAVAANPLTAQYSYFTTATKAPSARPVNSASRYEVYSTYLFFTIGADSTLINYNMYMEIWPANKPQQKKTWSFGEYVKTYTISGLKPNTKYKTRLYYGLSTSVRGPKSTKVVSFKTGPNVKPAVKSVKVQAINVKRIKQHHVSPYDGYVYRTIYDIYYTYNLKTTVTLKNAPKAKGFNYIMINDKNIPTKKGKKVYTVTSKKQVRYYTSPRGKKHTVGIALFQKKAWKGYTKLWQKSLKIK